MPSSHDASEPLSSAPGTHHWPHYSSLPWRGSSLNPEEEAPRTPPPACPPFTGHRRPCIAHRASRIVHRIDIPQRNTNTGTEPQPRALLRWNRACLVFFVCVESVEVPVLFPSINPCTEPLPAALPRRTTHSQHIHRLPKHPEPDKDALSLMLRVPNTFDQTLDLLRTARDLVSSPPASFLERTRPIPERIASPDSPHRQFTSGPPPLGRHLEARSSVPPLPRRPTTLPRRHNGFSAQQDPANPEGS